MIFTIVHPVSGSCLVATSPPDLLSDGEGRERSPANNPDFNSFTIFRSGVLLTNRSILSALRLPFPPYFTKKQQESNLQLKAVLYQLSYPNRIGNGN